MWHEHERRPERVAPPATAVPRTPASGPARILALQRLAGNRAVAGLLRAPGVQRCSCGGRGGDCCSEKDQPAVQGWWDTEDEGAEGSAHPLADSVGGAIAWAKEKAGAAAGWVDQTWSEWTGGAGDADAGGEPVDLPEVAAASVECDADEAVGYGKGTSKKVSLHGRTVSNYNHGRPIPPPFPPTVTVTTGKAGKRSVFTATGTFDVTFTANPAITLPSVPSGLRPCQEKAVKAFIDGPLKAHEEDHKRAFTSNYDGTYTATVDVRNILDTPVYRQRAMENPVNEEDVRRTKAANAASKALDPWKRTVTGMDCKD